MKFIIQGYSEKMGDGSLTDVCTFELLATNKKEALNKAKSIVKKKKYRITAVIEKDNDVSQTML